MNEEYLWNRTGSDPEIERLENALKPVRFAGSVPPRLPAKVAIREKAPRRSFFGLWLVPAFAAIAIAIFTTIAYWPPARDVQVTAGAAEDSVPQARASASQPEDQPSPVTVPPVQKPAPIVTLYKVPRRRTPQPAKLVAMTSSRKVPRVKLTDEEKFAYGQLMLALSITSSKLKIVKDALDGPETSTVVPVK